MAERTDTAVAERAEAERTPARAAERAAHAQPVRAPAAGSGALRCALVDGASAAVHSSATAPLKLLVPRPRGPAVWAFAASFGGGLLAGDRLALDVAVGPGASALLGTQASTKVYRADGRGAAHQRLDAEVAAGGALALLPDPVVAFAGAAYEQRQTIALATGASLLLLDWYTSGRSARDERWAFTSFRSRNRVTVGGALLVDDALHLAAGPALARRMGRFHCLASVLLLGPRCAPAAQALLAALAGAPVVAGAALLESASPLGDGALLRLAGTTHQAVEARVRERLAALAAGLLGDDPWSRKS